MAICEFLKHANQEEISCRLETFWGESSVKPARVRSRSATGDDMGVIGSVLVRGWCGEQLVDLTGLVATRATRFLRPGTFECWV